MSDLKNRIELIANETKTAQQIKKTAIDALLANISKVDLFEVCESLGWTMGSDGKPPAQKHYKVAIIHQLIKTAISHNWHFINETDYFYIYNGAYWVVLFDAEVKQLLKDAAIRMGHIEIECRDSLFVDKLFQQAKQDGFFAERNYKKQSIINLKNGSLVLSSEGVNLKSFDHKDFLTHQLDFSYSPNAFNKVFLKYLEEVLPNEDTRKTLQEVAGYLFIKGFKLERFFFLYGQGANGKSVFFEVLNGIIGSENISNYSLESITDDKGYHRAMLKDKIVNYGTDIRLTKIDAGMFKTMASGEPVEARLPYKEPFMMSDYAKLIFNVNKMDNANVEHTHGFWRRFLIIPFDKTIPDESQDKDLHKKILQDRAGVLNWIIEGAERVIKNRDIFVSSECEALKKKFMKESDTVAMYEADFLGANYPIINYNKTVTDAYNSYKAFCNDAGHRFPLNRNNFTERMVSLGFHKSRSGTGQMLRKNYCEKKVVNETA